MPDIAEAKRQLEAQRAELEDRLSRIERDLAETPDADSSERAVQMEDDEALEGQATVISNEIASVRRALERIDAGNYGDCVKCGEPIAEGRLQARPEAALCIGCASGD
jgi:RNA polymerase-binding protein DksA